MALIIVMLVMMVVTLVPLTLFAESIQALPIARHEQDWQSALQAAQSGVEDYLNRLEANPNYYLYNRANPDSPENPAFTGWVAVPGTATGEYFQYDVYNATAPSTGSVTVISSGAAGLNKSVVRTIRVTLHLQGFGDFLYYTDHETQDPTITGLSAAASGSSVPSQYAGTTSATWCNEEAWQYNYPWSQLSGSAKYGPDMSGMWRAFPNSSRSYTWFYVPACSFIPSAAGTVSASTYQYFPGYTEVVQFATGSVLNGPVASQDSFYMCGSPTFNGNVQSEDDQGVSNSTAGSTSYQNPGYYNSMPSSGWAGSTALPPTVGYTDPVSGVTYGLGQTVANQSQYFGVAYAYDYSCGSASPYFKLAQGATAVAQPASVANLAIPQSNASLAASTTPQSPSNPGGCLYNGPITVTFSTGGAAVGSGTMTVTLGSGSTVATSTSSPNVTYKCTGSNIPDPPNGVLYDQTASTCTTASCQANVNVSGTVNDQITIGSDTLITLTGSLVDASLTGSDVIGLSAPSVTVGTGAGESSSSTCYINGSATATTNCLEIDAEILATKHSFTTADAYSPINPTPTLYIYGSLAQEYRGVVATSSGSTIASGYQKAYYWDSRLANIQPPYFTPPTVPVWSRSSFGECKPTSSPSAALAAAC